MNTSEEYYDRYLAFLSRVKGYEIRAFDEGGLGQNPDHEIMERFFKGEKKALEPFFGLSSEEKIKILLNHSFLHFHDHHIEYTHSLSHICEDNLFSAEDGPYVGATTVALDFQHFFYLAEDLINHPEIFPLFKQSVFTAWSYFYIDCLFCGLEFIVKKDPTCAEGIYYLAECCQSENTKNHERAYDNYSEFIKLVKDKPNPENNYFISECYYKYFSYEPSQIEAYTAMAYLKNIEGNFLLYEEFLKKAIDVDPWHHQAPYIELAYFYLKSGRVEESLNLVTTFENVIEARIRSRKWAEEFYYGFDKKWKSDCFEFKENFRRNSFSTDCIEINESRMCWRVRKYPFLSVQARGKVCREPERENHLYFNSLSYKDIHTLIHSFYLNIAVLLSKREDLFASEKIMDLIYKAKDYPSRTFSNYPALKAYDIPMLPLDIYLKTGSMRILDMVIPTTKHILRLSPENEKANEVKERILKECSWQWNNAYNDNRYNLFNTYGL